MLVSRETNAKRGVSFDLKQWHGVSCPNLKMIIFVSMGNVGQMK